MCQSLHGALTSLGPVDLELTYTMQRHGRGGSLGLLCFRRTLIRGFPHKVFLLTVFES